MDSELDGKSDPAYKLKVCGPHCTHILIQLWVNTSSEWHLTLNHQWTLFQVTTASAEFASPGWQNLIMIALTNRWATGSHASSTTNLTSKGDETLVTLDRWATLHWKIYLIWDTCEVIISKNTELHWGNGQKSCFHSVVINKHSTYKCCFKSSLRLSLITLPKGWNIRTNAEVTWSVLGVSAISFILLLWAWPG